MLRHDGPEEHKMNGNTSRRASRARRDTEPGTRRLFSLLLVAMAISMPASAAAAQGAKSRSTWPQAYSVVRDDTAGILSLSTPYYTIEQDLRRGGAISRITLKNGRAANLLVSPVATRVRDENGIVLTDLGERAPKVTHRRSGLREIVTVESALTDARGRGPGLRVKTTYEYRWGYIKIHREFLLPEGGLRLRELCPFSPSWRPA